MFPDIGSVGPVEKKNHKESWDSRPVMKQECSVIVRWRDFIIPLILLLIVSLVCQSDRELDDRSH